MQIWKLSRVDLQPASGGVAKSGGPAAVQVDVLESRRGEAAAHHGPRHLKQHGLREVAAERRPGVETKRGSRALAIVKLDARVARPRLNECVIALQTLQPRLELEAAVGRHLKLPRLT